jgi:hypothetical protein
MLYPSIHNTTTFLKIPQVVECCVMMLKTSEDVKETYELEMWQLKVNFVDGRSRIEHL